MAKHKIILISFVCFSVVVMAGQRPSYIPPKIPRRKPGMTSEEYKKQVSQEINKALEQQKRQRRDSEREYMNFLSRQAWLRLLRISERQWMLIEPKYEKVGNLIWQSRVGAASGGSSMEKFHWNRPSESYFGPMADKSRDQMPEGYRIVEELIDLLEDDKSTDELIREKIDALQQARESAQKTLSKARQELAATLTTPRQEAVFLLLGHID